jgi:catechol 2,3-dioxygenase-like lactoylglutathione lyase family enzyme
MSALAHELQPAPRLQGLDHISVRVGDYGRAKRAYERMLRPLGLGLRLDWPDGRRAYFGAGDELSCVWLTESPAPGGAELSFAAPDREAVDAFYAAALAGGATSRRAPGLQPDYTARAYAAEVVDADGNVLEAVCR